MCPADRKTHVRRGGGSLRRFLSSGFLWLAVAFSSILRASKHRPSAFDKNEQALKIIVLTMDRPKELRNLLRSLDNAHYQGSKNLQLEIHMDFSASKRSVGALRVAKHFKFRHGSKFIRRVKHQKGLARSWYDAWTPGNDLERAIILEDDIILSPFWYTWLTTAWDKYGDRDELAGISLQKQLLIPQKPSKQMEMGVANSPFLFPLVGSIGFSPRARIWKMFLQWVNGLPDNFDVSIPLLVTSDWWNELDKRHMWTQHFIYFCMQRGFYTLYASLPGKVTLASHMRSKGAHFNKNVGPDFLIMKRKTAFMFPDEVVKYDWSGELQQMQPEGFTEVSASALQYATVKENARSGFVYLMFVNAAYTQFAKSWLCNIGRLSPSVLRSTFIVADSYITVRELAAVKANANYFVFATNRRNAVSYGTYEYYRVVADRIMVQKTILEYGVNVMIIEADQTWLADISPIIATAFSTQHSQIVAGDERSTVLGEERCHICGGFYGISAKASNVFSRYVEKHLTNMRQYENTTGIIDMIDDQTLLTAFVTATNLSVFWFHKCEYATGQWYLSAKYRKSCPRPTVIHNNYVVGNSAKKDRAKARRHWFFDESRNMCAIS
jgi:hypothetical protein